MRTCLLVLSLILGIEVWLALRSGVPEVAALLGGVVSVGGVLSLRKGGGGEWGWVFLVALYVIAAVILVGAEGMPAVLIAVSALHFVAWYYSARAIHSGAPELLPGTLDGRPGLFAVAFYGALVPAVLLVRGGMFPVDPPIAIPLAFVLFVLGLVAMEKGQFQKFRAGSAAGMPRRRGMIARALAGVGITAGLFFVFSKPIPALADGVVTMVRDLQGKSDRDSGLDADDMPDLDDIPESRLAPDFDPDAPDTEDDRGAGGDRVSGDPQSNKRSLPHRADIQTTRFPAVHLVFDDNVQAAEVASRPMYVRSSTLGSFNGKDWELVGGDEWRVWFHDNDDGVDDGVTHVVRSVEGTVHCDVYVRNATGASLPSIQGATSYGLERVFRHGDDWFRAPVTGNVKYRAGARPMNIDSLLDAGDIAPGNAGDREFLHLPETFAVKRMEMELNNNILVGEMAAASLLEKLLFLRQYMRSNYAYSRKIENPDLIDPLENFLFEEKRGYCDFFATSGALWARLLGVPSRIGYGYSSGNFDGKTVFTFFTDQAHSWTEIYLKGHGWVVYDMTPVSAGAGEVGGQNGISPPVYSEPNDGEGLDEFEDQSDPESEASPDDPGGLGGQIAKDFRADGSALSDLLGYILFCVALVAFALWYFLKGDPDKEVQALGGGEGKKGIKLPPYLAEFRQLLQAFGLDPQHGETLVEMLKSLRGTGVPVDGFDAMKRYHYATRYADEPHDAKQEKRFLQEVRSFLKERLKSRG